MDLHFIRLASQELLQWTLLKAQALKLEGFALTGLLPRICLKGRASKGLLEGICCKGLAFKDLLKGLCFQS